MTFHQTLIDMLQAQRRATAAGRPRAAAHRLEGIVAALSAGPHSFASTQVQLPVELQNRCVAFAAAIPDGQLEGDGRETDSHVTVKYGLHSDDVEPLKRLLLGFGPVRVRLGRVSVFPAREPDSQRGGPGQDVVKIEVDSPDLHRLNALVATLPHTDTFPAYVPHCTLAYVRPGYGRLYDGRLDFDGEEFAATHLTFSTTAGERHDLWLCGARQDLATGVWDREKHPRGQPDNRGQFREVDAATAAEWHGIREAARQRVAALVFDRVNSGVPRMERAACAAALDEVLGHLTAPMVAAALEHVGAVECFVSPERLTDECFPGEKVLTGGAWVWADDDEVGTLKLDGDTPSAGRREVYAHELGHALDWKHRHSDTPEWRAAWAAEIDADDNPLNTYSRVDRHEGFAEFVRLCGSGQWLEARLFPKCYQCLRQWGYVR